MTPAPLRDPPRVIRDTPRRMNDPQPGQWMIRCCRGCPEVAARVWLCSHEPGDPSNEVDQPYLQGQIGLDLVEPAKVWLRRGREITADEFLFQIQWLLWAQKNAPTDPRFTFRRPVDLAAIPIPQFELGELIREHLAGMFPTMEIESVSGLGYGDVTVRLRKPLAPIEPAPIEPRAEPRGEPPNCARCRNGEKPCIRGNPRNCEYPQRID